MKEKNKNAILFILLHFLFFSFPKGNDWRSSRLAVVAGMKRLAQMRTSNSKLLTRNSNSPVLLVVVLLTARSRCLFDFLDIYYDVFPLSNGIKGAMDKKKGQFKAMSGNRIDIRERERIRE